MTTGNDEGRTFDRAYTHDVYQMKCGVLFEHVFETFGDPEMEAKV